MNLEKLLLELSDSFIPRGGMVSKEVIDKKLKDNKYDNINVNAQKGAQLNYNNKNGVSGEGAVPLKCKKDSTHKLVLDGKFTFNKLKAYFKNKTHKEICKTCADEQGKTTTGTSQSEIEIKNELVDYITNELQGNVTVKFGSDKAKAEYKSRTGKSYLDYDIKITDNNDGTKTFALSILGPSHYYAGNLDVNDNDTIRAIEEFKAGRKFFISPAIKKGEDGFERKINEMKIYLRIIYNKITPPEESSKTKKLIKKFGENSEQVKAHIEQKKTKIEDTVQHVERGAINRQLSKIVSALRDNIGYKNATYNGKYTNLIDFINHDDDDRATKSFVNNPNEWNKLLTANKNEFRDWVAKNQAISNFDKQYYGKRTEKGNLISKKLFEDKK